MYTYTGFRIRACGQWSMEPDLGCFKNFSAKSIPPGPLYFSNVRRAEPEYAMPHCSSLCTWGTSCEGLD
ncbi:uncharacterized protein PGTG_22417 [Puccinia graminis f. sp. tritici CRL 75-36-700-3]|uniref:Uncharacterized protein n=1 Tax=Puccinia graminis f. sp. tritici (strain CRL 75-36-700-3 / race SCCL) TaxID=418459 RepID=H6QUL4_PUCGT|nr:uncharacterized protein PGTG_22417 [Puccinia graminis f. sp. tritici CRL 75-36-700-3]EHS64721.1 hypothetical protein PGTG_22417 [Puccinia graminis f. sp. tritici CRL 75-36-700-3]